MIKIPDVSEHHMGMRRFFGYVWNGDIKKSTAFRERRQKRRAKRIIEGTDEVIRIAKKYNYTLKWSGDKLQVLISNLFHYSLVHRDFNIKEYETGIIKDLYMLEDIVQRRIKFYRKYKKKK